MNDEIKNEETPIKELEVENIETPEDINEQPQTNDDDAAPLTSATVHVKFISNSDKIQIITKATQEKNTIAAANKALRLIHGRLYYVPIDTELNSDEFGNLKQYSETSDKFEVKYIKDGFACIDPIQHNTQLTDGQKLCILW